MKFFENIIKEGKKKLSSAGQAEEKKGADRKEGGREGGEKGSRKKGKAVGSGRGGR